MWPRPRRRNSLSCSNEASKPESAPFARRKLGMPRFQPLRYRSIQLRKVSREEMIGGRNHGDLRLLLNVRTEAAGHRFELPRRAVPIELSGHEQLGFRAGFEVGNF